MDHNTTIEDLKERITELEQEKTQLLKMVSHDVKSPFNKLFALSNLLQLVSEDLNDEQLDYLTRMEWVIKEGLTVVRNLMDMRAIGNKSIELSVEEVSLNSVLEENLKNYHKQSATKNISVTTKMDKVTVQSDKRLLERVVDHLVSNAIKYTPKESVINVELSQSDSDIDFTISSHSGPIPKDEIGNLFNRSSPLSTRPTHGESALGNGLFIAQNYARYLGGGLFFNQENSLIQFSLKMPKKLII
jgi:signal transduction histidine kinase